MPKTFTLAVSKRNERRMNKVVKSLSRYTGDKNVRSAIRALVKAQKKIVAARATALKAQYK